MAITIKNADVLVKLTKEKLDQIENRLKAVLDDEILAIQLRTRQGKDVDGADFKKYTPAYAKFRSEGRVTRDGKRVGGGRRAHPPDLTYKGDMLRAMKVKIQKLADKTLGIIEFNSALEAAKASGNQLRRKFFGFSEEQKQRITRKLIGDDK